MLTRVGVQTSSRVLDVYLGLWMMQFQESVLYVMQALIRVLLITDYYSDKFIIICLRCPEAVRLID